MPEMSAAELKGYRALWRQVLMLTALAACGRFPDNQTSKQEAHDCRLFFTSDRARRDRETVCDLAEISPEVVEEWIWKMRGNGWSLGKMPARRARRVDRRS